MSWNFPIISRLLGSNVTTGEGGLIPWDEIKSVGWIILAIVMSIIVIMLVR